MKKTLLLGISTFICAGVFAQSTPQRPEITAVFAETAPQIDGVLDDDIWQLIEPTTSFVQRWPEEGATPTEDSELRIAFNEDFLYFGLTFLDKNPEEIRANIFERGGRLDKDDVVRIGIDTYNDKRNAYVFEINSLGAQDDATITDESMTLDDWSWDAVFYSETVIDEKGWSLEVAIPFRQIRFSKDDVLEMGVAVERTINRKNEKAIFPFIPLSFQGGWINVSQYATLKGLQGLRRGRNIEIKPYIITGAQEVREDLAFEKTESDLNREIGLDVKYGITSNLTLDLTFNTDFAQVEADNVQLNLTRFNLFFPEKREFFLERSGLFAHGNQRSTQTFFSRRIGLSRDILTGARMTGQIGRFSVGLLNIETGDKLNQAFGKRSDNNAVARIRTDLFPRATAGAIFTNFEQDGRYNRAFGVDAQYRFWNSSEIEAWYTTVKDTDPDLDDAAGHARLRVRNDIYGASASYTSVGKNYSPALGFVSRRDMRHYSINATYSPFIESDKIPVRQLSFEPSYRYITGQDGEKQSWEGKLEVGASFEKRDRLRFEFERQFDRLTGDFHIRSNTVIPAGDYTFDRYRISGNTDQSRQTYFSGGVVLGEFYNGNRTDLSAQVGFRQSKHFSIEAGISHRIIDLDADNGKFDATTISANILAAQGRKLFARGLIQYDNFSRDVNANIRIDWIHTPGSDLFIVLNTSYHLTADDDILFDPRRDIIMNDRVGVAKVTYLVML